MELTPFTTRESRVQKKRVLSHDFRAMSERQRQLHHTVAATWYIAHKNLKLYKIVYPLCALACVGSMAAICATKAPSAVKAASMIALPFAVATVMNKRDKAVKEARQAKEECHQVLRHFRNSNPKAFSKTDFKTKYPAMYAQSNTLRASLLKHEGSFSYFLMRSWADLAMDLRKKDRARG